MHVKRNLASQFGKIDQAKWGAETDMYPARSSMDLLMGWNTCIHKA
jgi:hypothetical protein